MGNQCSDFRSDTEREKRRDSEKIHCQTIMDALKFSNVFTDNIIKERITVIKSTDIFGE